MKKYPKHHSSALIDEECNLWVSDRLVGSSASEHVIHELTLSPHNQAIPPLSSAPSNMMSSMSFLDVAATPSTFSVVHPLYCGSIAFQQQQLSPLRIKTLTASSLPPSQLNSPTSTKARKSRLIFDFTTEMAKYFHMSQREAAQQLGVATVTIKRNCRRLGIVWPYRLMKSKKHSISCPTISREYARRLRQERTLERAKTGCSPSKSNRSRSRSPSTFRSNVANRDEAATKVVGHSSNSSIELTEAGRAFARLPLDCMDASN